MYPRYAAMIELAINNTPITIPRMFGSVMPMMKSAIPKINAKPIRMYAIIVIIFELFTFYTSKSSSML